jgi:hypothetical protein
VSPDLKQSLTKPLFETTKKQNMQNRKQDAATVEKWWAMGQNKK